MSKKGSSKKVQRRRGKQSGRSTPSSSSSQSSNNNNEEASKQAAATTIEQKSNSDNAAEAATTSIESTNTKDNATPDHNLVLTSEKRRGIYECDYCHSDISQLPRIRCAVCPDFDLCLDCFATTDHAAAIAKLKAAASAHGDLKGDGISPIAGVSPTFANHDDSHGYRVCDCTRYPIFPSTKCVIPQTATKGINKDKQSNENKNNDDDDEDDDDDNNKSSVRKEAIKINDTEKNNDNNDNKRDVSDDKMDVDSAPEKDDKKKVGSDDGEDDDNDKSGKNQVVIEAESTNNNTAEVVVVSEDPKSIWTAEEDLRLLDAILTHGLGNWVDISEAISGNGSIGKTPKRCMERYFDDFLGRYGHILPPHTAIDYDSDDDENDTKDGDDSKMDDDDTVNSSTRLPKRRHASMSRSTSNVSSSSGGGRTRKKVKAVPTESLSEYKDLWPEPYLPDIPGVQMGQEVGRDQSYKAELAFVKATTTAPSKQEADKIRKEWMETKLNQFGSPTVLPPRPEDIMNLPGAELAGFMPRRGDFDIEWENEAEQAIADMEFCVGDLPQDRQLKLQVLEIYNQKLDEREKRKQFILSRKLYDYRSNLKAEQSMPRDERDLVRRMRLFERLHTPEEHKQFVADLLKAMRLRKEIAKLQMYRRIGIRSLAEAEKYELDKNRRQFHKAAQLQKEAEAKSRGTTTLGSATSEVIAAGLSGALSPAAFASNSLWKQYRTSDRKVRRSINRLGSGVSDDTNTIIVDDSGDGGSVKNVSIKDGEAKDESKPSQDATRMDVDGEKKPAAVATTTVDCSTDKAENKPNAENKVAETTAVPETTKKDSKQQTEQGESKPEASATSTATTTTLSTTKTDASATAASKSQGQDDKDNFDITTSTGYELLSSKEAALCLQLKIYPSQYLSIKKALIHESLTRGLLDKDPTGTGRRTMVKIDIEKEGNIIDFLVRAGWVSSKLTTTTAKSVV